MSHFVKSDIVKVAEELGFDFEELSGENYRNIHDKILKVKPELHTREELKELAQNLSNKILDEYGFDAWRVFSRYPLIRTKGYKGFDEVYLYKKIHIAMGCTAKAFCCMHQISHNLDKAILEYEFSEIYANKYGFLSHMVGDCEELILLLKMINRHRFDPEFIKTIEIDLEIALVEAGDKFFHKHLDDETLIRQLYQIAGETYGFDEYRFGIFQDYDGYGNVILRL